MSAIQNSIKLATFYSNVCFHAKLRSHPIFTNVLIDRSKGVKDHAEISRMAADVKKVIEPLVIAWRVTSAINNYIGESFWEAIFETKLISDERFNQALSAFEKDLFEDPLYDGYLSDKRDRERAVRLVLSAVVNEVGLIVEVASAILSGYYEEISYRLFDDTDNDDGHG